MLHGYNDRILKVDLSTGFTAHTDQGVDETLNITEDVLKEVKKLA